MRKMLDRAFACYGIPAKLESADGKPTVQVFFHSINSQSWQNMERVYFPLGEIPRGQYICVFPADAPVSRGDTVVVNSRSYLVSKLETMHIHTGPLYQWSLCVEKGSGEAWS